ncbi:MULTISPECIES: phage shock envelope stress response protein PspM [Protofrankia]|uniref:Uncharacterized protein n=1 Tax=Candidatus Protofrankia datiscae TaxID=2716812 RepID=F8B392_9ACTN|nr:MULTISPECIES: hypothetical protein [Protofrankia]AEH10892.1 hypothetical protein FsymDg_3613 [Candidatus Protofrankia datiscae]
MLPARGTGPSSRLPEWLRADIERRNLLRGEQRLIRAQARQRRRAAASARAWSGVAVLTPAVAVLDGTWGWLVVGVGALVRAGLSWRQARAAPALPAALPLPTAPLPSRLRLRGSAAAEPLHRGEAAVVALAAMLRSLPPGAAAEAVRAAMASAAQVVDGLRGQAARVLACESAARTVVDPGRRAEITTTIKGLVSSMTTEADALDEMLAAASDLLASTPSALLPAGAVAGRDGELERGTAALRGFADGLRELMRDGSGP